MANKQKGEAPLFIGGQTRSLKFTMNSIAELEDELGLSVDDFEHATGFKAIRGFIWAGLLHTNPKLKIEQVGVWFDQAADESDIVEFRESCTEAVRRAFLLYSGIDPDAEEVEAKPPEGELKEVSGAGK